MGTRSSPPHARPQLSPNVGAAGPHRPPDPRRSPGAQRRAALDFLSKSIRDLEIAERCSAAHEERAKRLENELRRADELAEQYLRRCNMLEAELQRERAKNGGGEGAAPAATATAAEDEDRRGRCYLARTLSNESAFGIVATMLPSPPVEKLDACVPEAPSPSPTASSSASPFRAAAAMLPPRAEGGPPLCGGGALPPRGKCGAWPPREAQGQEQQGQEQQGHEEQWRDAEAADEASWRGETSAAGAAAAGAAEEEFDIDALIAEQRALPVVSQHAAAKRPVGRVQPMKVQGGGRFQIAD